MCPNCKLPLEKTKGGIIKHCPICGYVEGCDMKWLK